MRVIITIDKPPLVIDGKFYGVSQNNGDVCAIPFVDADTAIDVFKGLAERIEDQRTTWRIVRDDDGSDVDA